MYTGVLHICLCDGVSSSGTGIAVVSSPVWLRIEPGILEEHPVLVTAESSLQPRPSQFLFYGEFT